MHSRTLHAALGIPGTLHAAPRSPRLSPPAARLPQFHTGASAVDSADFLPLLKRLDDCIAYVAANPQVGAAAMGIFRAA